MPVEFGEPSIPGQTFLKIQNPSEDEDYGNKAGGGGGTQSQQEVLQVLHRRLQRGRGRDWTGAAAVRYNNNLQLSAARWGGTAVTWPRAEKTFGGRVFCNFCRYRRESGIGFIRCFGFFFWCCVTLWLPLQHNSTSTQSFKVWAPAGLKKQPCGHD